MSILPRMSYCFNILTGRGNKVLVRPLSETKVTKSNIGVFFDIFVQKKKKKMKLTFTLLSLEVKYSRYFANIWRSFECFVEK